MNIEIEFKIINDSEIRVFQLLEDSYFDPLENDETFESEGIPVYNDVRQYILKQFPKISLIHVEYGKEIVFKSTDSEYEITSRFYADGKSKIVSRKEKNGFESIIHSIQISDHMIFISRLERDNIQDNWITRDCSLGINYENGASGEESWHPLLKGPYNSRFP